MKRFRSTAVFPAPSRCIDKMKHRMNLPDAPIAQEGFFAAQFLTVGH
jgi:hypothetical protein